MKKIFLAAFTLLLTVVSLSAQHAPCGTSQHDQFEMRERLIRNRANAAHQESAGERDVDYYVPLKMHLVGRGDGTQRVSEALMVDFLCQLNTDYADQDIQFYYDFPFNYINNDQLFSNPQGSGGGLQITLNKVNDAINIFIVGSFQQAGLLGYYQGPWPSNDFIVIRQSAVIGETVTHEMGHFFSLPHPFFGWEPPSNEADNPYAPQMYQGWSEQFFGLSVGPNSPSYDFGVPVPNEKVDQSNCMTAADAICDTPPDYLFAFSNQQSGCNDWNGGAQDPDGVEVDVMENNFMSYFQGCSDFTFTSDQRDAIIADLESSERSYIRPGYTPDLTEITETINLVEPIGGETTSGYDVVAFDWDPVAGAQKYVLEISITPAFTIAPQRYVLDATYKLVYDFNPNITYYWRVRPLSEYASCGAAYSANGTFKTGTALSAGQIDAVNAWNISPNPVTTSQALNVEIDATQAFEAEINMYNVAGQLVQTINNQNYGVGTNNVALKTAGLNPGLYIVTITSENGVMNQKVVVTK